jgi:hypothetical protein
MTTGSHFIKHLDARVLSLFGGIERTETEYLGLLARAGFRARRAGELAHELSLIEARPAGDQTAGVQEHCEWLGGLKLAADLVTAAWYFPPDGALNRVTAGLGVDVDQQVERQPALCVVLRLCLPVLVLAR